jgi:N-acetylglucosamine-6-phosphate deacetylase
MSGGDVATIWSERVLLPDGLQAANVIVAEGRIARVQPGGAASAARRLPSGAILAPGFIDAQVNGGGGVLFNDATNQAGLRAIAGAHRAGGTTGLLPTLITDAPARMSEAVAAVRAARAVSGSGILGLHLEGPFISPARPGIHPASFIRPMVRADRDALLVAAGSDLGVLLVTLAPEEVADEDLATLAGAGIVLAAGHTVADAARLGAARRAGLRGYTHLWNAMPPVAGRAPGPVGVCLGDERAWCGVIADGVHVDPLNLLLTMRCKPGRVFLVTDAMPPAGTGLGGFSLLGRVIERRDGALRAADGTLAGADLTMIEAVRNVMTMAGASLEDALRMGSEAPAAFLGLAGRGRIEVGAFADLIVLSDGLEVMASAVEGVWNDGMVPPWA